MLTFETPDPLIRLSARNGTDGPESDLIRRFVATAIPRFQRQSRRYEIAIFHEPALEIGFPDLVISVYDPRRYKDWSEARSSLELQDLKILCHLYHVNGSNSSVIESQLGISEQAVNRAMERLHEANLVRQIHNEWRPLPIQKTFGVVRLMSFEAKIADWTSVFAQARRNQWFASETYVLSPVVHPSAKTLERSKQLSIGIYSCSNVGVTEIAASARFPLPYCYASWLFNEWIGRRLFTS